MPALTDFTNDPPANYLIRKRAREARKMLYYGAQFRSVCVVAAHKAALKTARALKAAGPGEMAGLATALDKMIRLEADLLQMPLGSRERKLRPAPIMDMSAICQDAPDTDPAPGPVIDAEEIKRDPAE